MDAREIDALIAEHLMGWTWRAYPKGTMRIFRPAGWLEDTTVPWDGSSNWEPLKDPYRLVEHYSTTWEGMGRVVEAMQKREWSVNLLWLAPDYDAHAVFYRHSRGMDPPIGDDGEFADTASMAVSLAALAALGVKVPA